MSDFDSDPVQTEPEASPGGDGEMSKEARQWAMMLHFSILVGFVIPVAGLVAPVLIWQLKKEDFPQIGPHAHVVMNWIITGIVYWVISFVLILAFGLGFLLMMALGLATVVFSIIGGIKANEGELWEYPMTLIKVFK